jgi:hypothetical protein
MVDTILESDSESERVEFNWRNPKITNWKKILRIKFNHSFKDIDCRGLSAQEVASDILRLHKKDLSEEELEFIKSVLI